MRNIIFISSFDPICNNDIRDFELNNSQDTKFYFCVLFSKYSSLEDRVQMINLALRNENINYEIDSSLSKEYDKSIDLVKLCKTYSLKGINNISVLIQEENKAYLVSYDKILNIKAKFNPVDTIINSSTQIRFLKNLNTKKEVIDYIVRNHLYFMSIVENYIHGKRLEHCISVANTAYDIAVGNKLKNPDLFYVSGLLHDIGKEVKRDESLEIIEKYFRKYVDMPEWSYHEFVGAILAKKLFPYVSKCCISAILTHCTGDENMSPMQMIIYASDKIEPTRGYDSSELIKECENDFKKGFLLVLNKNMEFVSQNDSSPSSNILTRRCLLCYAKEWVK
ncbi:MAG: bis(5'-nucleosyl)-tetraphosphatase (symmetrical) YqeK [Bacilli bacterium]|jgi:predicted HD superfamily hydrolase involved in NAD metabolism